MKNLGKLCLALGVASVAFLLMGGNVSALGVSSLEELQSAINGGESEIDLASNITGSVNIPAGSNLTINGNGKTITGGIQFAATISGSNNTTHVSISNLTLDGNNTSTYGLISQNQNTTPVQLYLDLYNVTVKDFVNKGAYFTNVQSLTINDCTFTNNATSGTDWYKGDYAVDVNLIGIQNSVITIDNSTFDGVVGGKGAIKVTQRGTENDVMTDIPYYYDGGQRTGNPAASIQLLSIENNNFDGVVPKGGSTYMGDVIKGSSPNADGTARSAAGEFPYVLVAGGSQPTSLFVRGSAAQEADNPSTLLTEIPAGTSDYDEANVIEVKVEYDPALNIPNEVFYNLKTQALPADKIDQIIATAEAKITNPDSQMVQLLVDGSAYDPTREYSNDVVITVAILDTTEEGEEGVIVDESNPNTVDPIGFYVLLIVLGVTGVGASAFVKKQA